MSGRIPNARIFALSTAFATTLVGLISAILGSKTLSASPCSDIRSVSFRIGRWSPAVIDARRRRPRVSAPHGVPSGASDFASGWVRYRRRIDANVCGMTRSSALVCCSARRYVRPSWTLMQGNWSHSVDRLENGAMSVKRSRSAPTGYPRQPANVNLRLGAERCRSPRTAQDLGLVPASVRAVPRRP